MKTTTDYLLLFIALVLAAIAVELSFILQAMP